MKDTLAKQIQDLTEAIHATSLMTNEAVENLYKVSRKDALYNATFGLIKLIGELK